MQILLKQHKTIEEDTIAEQAMVENAKDNPANFASIYNKYFEHIFRFIYQRIEDKELSFDVTSQVFLKAMLNLHKYKYKGYPFSSWLYRVATNELNDLFKSNKTKRAIRINSVDIYNIIDEVEEDCLSVYHNELINAMSSLPEDDIQLIEMRYFEKRPFKEISEILEITENYAKVKMHRILDKLKKILTANSK